MVGGREGRIGGGGGEKGREGKGEVKSVTGMKKIPKVTIPEGSAPPLPPDKRNSGRTRLPENILIFRIHLTSANFQSGNNPFLFRIIPTFVKEPTAFSTKINSSTLKNMVYNLKVLSKLHQLFP